MTRIDPDKILPPHPFLTGMATALDIYGASGMKTFERIHRYWLAVNFEPRPSAEDSIQDSIVAVNSEYIRLLAGQES